MFPALISSRATTDPIVIDGGDEEPKQDRARIHHEDVLQELSAQTRWSDEELFLAQDEDSDRLHVDTECPVNANLHGSE
jgi:hypothetical protein